MSRSILVVEDEPIISADLCDRIVDLGYRIMAAPDNGEEALELLRDERPDLILMDVNLAGRLDGVETALRIQRDYDIPLIFLTSNSDDATFERARRAQPRAFLSKPFRGRDLNHAIQLIIGEPHGTDEPPAATKAPPGIEEDRMPEGESAALYQDRLFIKVKERLSRVMLADILWIEADDYYCQVVTEERKYLVTKTLKKLGDLLPQDGQFMRCHRSYIVNLQRVTEIGEIFVFIGKREVPVSRSKRAELLQRVKKQ